MNICFSRNCGYQLLRKVICFILTIAIFVSQINFNIVKVQAKENDYVKIVAISPNYYRSYTTEMTFTATIEYQLKSADHGIVSLGFNTDEPHSYHIYEQEEVENGKGTVTLQVTVTPVDWGSYWKAGTHLLDLFKGYSSMETDFKVYVNLSEYPHGKSQDPIAEYDFPLEYLTTEAEKLDPTIYWYDNFDESRGHIRKIQGNEKASHRKNSDGTFSSDPNGNYKQIDERTYAKEHNITEVTSGDYSMEEFHVSLEEIVSRMSSLQYNPELAYMLAALAGGAYSKRCTIENYEQLGIDIVGEPHNYFDEVDANGYKDNSSAFTIGEKQTWDGRRMILIVVRGSDGELGKSKDWNSNFNLGDAEIEIAWHRGFKVAANEIFDELKKAYGDKLPTDNTFYVVTGHSRGAAVANLLSVLLSDNGVPKLNVYDYNFACPDVARNLGTGWNWLGDHDNIFNIGNAPDPVTWIPGVFGNLLGNASSDVASLISLSKGGSVGNNGSDKLWLMTSESAATSWGKFGRTLWFNTEKVKGIGLNFDEHDWKNYIEHYSENKSNWESLDEMSTWEDITVESGVGKLIITGLLVGRLILIFCPVDVEVLNEDGEVIASITEGVVDYHGSNLGDIIVLEEDGHKLIYMPNEDTIDVNLVGNDDGDMTYISVRFNSDEGTIDDIQVFHDIEVKKAKQFTSHIDYSNSDNEAKNGLYVINRFGDNIAEVQEDGGEITVKGGFIAKLANQIWLIVLMGIILLALVIFITLFLFRKRGAKKNSAYMYDTGFTPPSGNAGMEGSYGSLLGGLSSGKQAGDILCSCGAINPAGVRTCMNCGKKLKKRR